MSSIPFRLTLGLVTTAAQVVFLAHALGRQEGTVTFLMTELECDRDRVMRFEQTMPGVRPWIGGLPLKHGDRVRFGVGCCQLLLEVRVDRIPAEGLSFSPAFWASDDPSQELAAWRALAARIRPYLERAVALAPESVEGRRAAEFLRHAAGCERTSGQRVARAWLHCASWKPQPEDDQTISR